jgi:hypothetical protein
LRSAIIGFPRGSFQGSLIVVHLPFDLAELNHTRQHTPEAVFKPFVVKCLVSGAGQVPRSSHFSGQFVYRELRSSVRDLEADLSLTEFPELNETFAVPRV